MSAQALGERHGKDCFVRFPKHTYSTIQEGLARRLVKRQIGRNGWAVMVTLCRTIYSDGRLGKMSSQSIQTSTGLTDKQVSRGMKELREKGIIEPIVRTTSQGYRHRDRSNLNHVAQYRFCEGTRNAIAHEDPDPSGDDRHGR